MDNEYVIPLDLRTEEFQKALPFELTGGANRTYGEKSSRTWHLEHAMSRLVGRCRVR